MLSAPMLRGKELYAKVLADLPKELEKYGFKSVQDVIDTHLTNKVTYEHELPCVEKAKCTHCALCMRNCPYFAINMDEAKVPTFDASKCFRCGLCASKCPVKAIKF
jgi:dihydroorotate dehydrogenase (fumarate)